MFVVCKPLGQITFQKKHAVGGILLSWLWSLTWNLPPLFGWGRYELEGVGTSCAPDWHSRDPQNVSYIVVYFAVCFAVPFAITLLSYTKLMWTLHQVSCYTSVMESKWRFLNYGTEAILDTIFVVYLRSSQLLCHFSVHSVVVLLKSHHFIYLFIL